MQSLSHMNTTTGVFDKHNVVVQRMINMTRHSILWTDKTLFSQADTVITMISSEDDPGDQG